MIVFTVSQVTEGTFSDTAKLGHEAIGKGEYSSPNS